MKSGLIYIYIYISFSFFYRSHSVLLEKIIHTQQDFYTLLWVSINECQVFISTINIKGGGGGGRSWQIFWSKIPEPKPLVLWFFTCRVSLSAALDSEASLQSSLQYCSGFSLSKSTGLPALPLLYQQQLTNIKILTVVAGTTPLCFDLYRRVSCLS